MGAGREEEGRRGPMSIAYWGSKKRFASEIADVLCAHGAPSRTLYEPFCGMASVGMAVLERGCFRRVAFSDASADVIAYWRGVAGGWLPDTKPLSQGAWTELRASRKRAAPSPRRSFYGYSLGFGGHFLAGKRPCRSLNHKGFLSRVRERIRAAAALLRAERGRWSFDCRPYERLAPARGSVIYCDPPYVVHTTSGGASNPGQHFTDAEMAALWERMRGWIRDRGCVVFLSAARLPPAPRGMYLEVEREWRTRNRIQTSKTGAGSRAETLVRVRVR